MRVFAGRPEVGEIGLDHLASSHPPTGEPGEAVDLVGLGQVEKAPSAEHGERHALGFVQAPTRGPAGAAARRDCDPGVSSYNLPVSYAVTSRVCSGVQRANRAPSTLAQTSAFHPSGSLSARGTSNGLCALAEGTLTRVAMKLTFLPARRTVARLTLGVPALAPRSLPAGALRAAAAGGARAERKRGAGAQPAQGTASAACSAKSARASRSSSAQPGACGRNNASMPSLASIGSKANAATVYGLVSVGILLAVESDHGETYPDAVGSVALALAIYWLSHSYADALG